MKECCGEECYFPLVLHIISILGTWLDQYLGFFSHLALCLQPQGNNIQLKKSPATCHTQVNSS